MKEKIKNLLFLLEKEDLENEEETQKEFDDLVSSRPEILLQISKEETNPSLSLTAAEEFCRVNSLAIVSLFKKYKNYEDDSIKERAVRLLENIKIEQEEETLLKAMFEEVSLLVKLSILNILKKKDEDFFKRKLVKLYVFSTEKERQEVLLPFLVIHKLY